MQLAYLTLSVLSQGFFPANLQVQQEPGASRGEVLRRWETEA